MFRKGWKQTKRGRVWAQLEKIIKLLQRGHNDDCVSWSEVSGSNPVLKGQWIIEAGNGSLELKSGM